MSDKNFMSYDDAAEVLGTFAERIKDDEYENITYEQWLAKTDEQKEAGNFLVSGVPNADGKVTINGCKLLWYNDGTVTSMATGDTITLNDDYSNYDFLYVTASWPQLTSSSINASCIMDVQHLKMEFLSVADTTTGGVQNARRILGFDSDTKKIKVYDCFRCQGSVAQSTQNDYLVPRRIYGIKLNHQLEIQAIARDVSTSADKCMDTNNVSVEERLTGIGTKNGIRLTTEDDLNDVYLNGFYSIKGSELPANSPSGIAADFSMVVISMNEVEVKQVLHCTSQSYLGAIYERVAYWVSPGTERVWTAWKRTDAIDAITDGESRAATSNAVFDFAIPKATNVNPYNRDFNGCIANGFYQLTGYSGVDLLSHDPVGTGTGYYTMLVVSDNTGRGFQLAGYYGGNTNRLFFRTMDVTSGTTVTFQAWKELATK